MIQVTFSGTIPTFVAVICQGMEVTRVDDKVTHEMDILLLNPSPATAR